MVRAAWSVAVLLGFAACSNDRSLIVIPEASADYESMVVVFEGPDGVRAFAGSVDDLVQANVSPPATLTLLLFHASLTDLALSPGEILQASEGCLLLDELDPDALFASALRDSGSDEWRATDETQLSSKVRGLRIERDTPCQKADRCRTWTNAEVIELPSSAALKYGVVLPDGQALLGTEDDEAFLVSANSSFESLAYEPAASIRSASVDHSGVLWLGGARLVHRATIDGAIVRLSPLPGRVPGDGGVSWISQPSSSTTGAGLIAVSSGGVIARHTSSTWEVLIDDMNPTTPGAANKGGIETVGPDEVIVVSGFEDRIFRVRDGVVDVQPSGLSEGLGAIATVPEIGTVVGTVPSGTFYSLPDSGPLEALAAEGLGLDARAMLAFGDGFVASGEGGNFREYVRGQGFCPLVQPLVEAVSVILPMGPEHLLVGGDASDDRALVVLLHGAARD